MNSRRFHSKSRNGCVQCKRRKTKCGEERPTCVKCIKRGETCSLSDASPAATPSNRRESGASSHPTIEASNIGEVSATGEQGATDVSFSAAYVLQNDEQDILRLIYNYGLSTCKSISDSPDTLPIWRDLVPALAFKHDFLLSGILAISSLHLGLLYPSSAHSKAALHHHTTGLELFRSHLSSITSENVSALFAFSCLVPLYSFGSRNLVTSPTSSQTMISLNEVFDLFTLLRGIAIIVKKGRHWLEQGDFAPFLLPVSSSLITSLPTPIEHALAILSTRNHQTTPDLKIRDAYNAAISELRFVFCLAQERPNAKMVVLPFPIMLKEDYMTEMREGNPMALVILAHYGALLHSLRGHLWMRGWGKEVVDAVRQELDEMEWGDCLDWPVRQVASGDQ